MAKSKWETHVVPHLEMIANWVRDGIYEKDICKRLGINPDTWNEYKNKKPDFAESLKRTKEVVDAQVENALLQRALGYEYEESKITTEGGIEKKEVMKKKLAPDVGAQIFWLKNRKRGVWVNNPELLKDTQDEQLNNLIRVLELSVQQTIEDAKKKDDK